MAQIYSAPTRDDLFPRFHLTTAHGTHLVRLSEIPSRIESLIASGVQTFTIDVVPPERVVK